MAFELGGFAENESVIDGDFNAFNFCLATDYLGAFIEEDFVSLGEMNNNLIDDIVYWLNYDGEIGKNDVVNINGIDKGSLITKNNRTFIQCIVDEHQADMAETYIMRGVKDPKLYLTCILYGDFCLYKDILNYIHGFVTDKEEYTKFLTNIFSMLEEGYLNIESSRQKIQFLERVKLYIDSIQYPKEYGEIDIPIDNYTFVNQLVKVR